MTSIDEDLKVLAQFIDIYCDNNHKSSRKKEVSVYETNVSLCQDCKELLDYASIRREVCPLDPKPTCKNCHIHCYKPELREKIRKVMRFSGIYLIKRGRIDLILHYLF
jgi:hypothetical protein